MLSRARQAPVRVSSLIERSTDRKVQSRAPPVNVPALPAQRLSPTPPPSPFARDPLCQAAVAGEGPMIVTQKKERLLTPKYCESINQSKRRPTRTVEVRPAIQLLACWFCVLPWFEAAVGLSHFTTLRWL